MDLFFTLFSSKNFSKILIKNNVGQLLNDFIIASKCNERGNPE
jgi:hypothetical protein